MESSVNPVVPRLCKLCLRVVELLPIPADLPSTFLTLDSTQILAKYVAGNSEYHPSCYESYMKLNEYHRVLELTLRGSHSHEIAGLLELPYLLKNLTLFGDQFRVAVSPLLHSIIGCVPDMKQSLETFDHLIAVVALRVQSISKYVRFLEDKVEEIQTLIAETKHHVYAHGPWPQVGVFITENLHAQRELVQTQSMLNMYPGMEMNGFPTTVFDMHNIRLSDLTDSNIKTLMLSTDVDGAARKLSNAYSDFIAFSGMVRAYFAHLSECLSLKKKYEEMFPKLLFDLSGYVQYLLDNRIIDLWHILSIGTDHTTPCTNLSIFTVVVSERTTKFKAENEKLLALRSSEYHMVEYRLLDLC